MRLGFHAFWQLLGTGFLALGLMLSGCSKPDPEAVSALVEAARAQSSDSDTQWQTYLGDKASSQYSSLAQINRANVHRLTLAWQYDASAGDTDLHGENQHNPLIVKGVLYGAAANAKRLFALNAATGEELWSWTPPETMEQVSRGLMYWSDESGTDERIFFGSGAYVYALNARSGSLVAGFGDRGALNLEQALVEGGRDVDFVAATTPGVIYKDLFIQGMRVNEFSGAAPGHIRAYDVRSGALRWRFNTIPQAGEFGADTWADDAYNQLGGANAWAGMSLDEERGIVFVPTGSAALDTYGADREGDNLFANTLLALDAETGERIWHYQIVRHDLWDRDLPSPPNLVTLQHEGKDVDVVVQATKSGHLFVFDRETGEPLHPIREEPVQGVPLPGEHAPKTQPLPVLPEPFTAQGLTPQGLDDRSPIIMADTAERLAAYDHGGVYNLPSLRGAILRPGFDGGAEWGGSAWDPQRQLLYINGSETASVLQMMPTEGTSMTEAMNLEAVYRMACAQCHGLDRRGAGLAPSLRDVGSRLTPWEIYNTIYNGRGRMPAIDHRIGKLGSVALTFYLYTAGDSEPVMAPSSEHTHYAHAGYPDFIASDGLPAPKPPWGTLNAVDLSSGKIRWRIPLGDYPEALAMGIEGNGAANYGGPVATAGGVVFIAATPDAKFRAFDSDTGKLLWEEKLPTGGFATPAVYSVGGKQYLAISASGTKLGNEKGRYFLAYTLDDAAPQTGLYLK